MLPILIGSHAYVHYFKECNVEPKDIDLIVDEDCGGKICLKAEKKDGMMIWIKNNDDLIKIDLTIAEKTSDKLIFEMCNKNNSDNQIVIYGITVIVPPLEYLYAIKKSHIHRILPLTKIQDNDIEIWHKHMLAYTKMRQKLGYKRMDYIIYGSDQLTDVLSLDKLNSESELEHTTRQIFIHRFNEVVSRVGDTTNTLDKTEDDFFKDNVERFIEHDKLHEMVGELFRRDPTPIFKKYQKDDDSVNLDRDSFLKSDRSERIQMIVEEIVVLFLERKWIPEVMNCYKLANVPYKKFNEEFKKKELREIGAHFMTNLAGQGHSWLRRYCLDHYEQLMDYKRYDFDELFKLVIKITGLENLNKSADMKLEDFLNKIKNLDCQNIGLEGEHFTSYQKNGKYIIQTNEIKNDSCINIVLDKAMDSIGDLTFSVH